MDDASWAKYAALGGPVFVVLAVVGGLLPGAPPSMRDDWVKVEKFFADHPREIRIGAFLTALAAIALVWWFGSLWRRMSAAEGGRPRLAVVAALGLLLSGAMTLAQNAVLAAVAFRPLDHGAGTSDRFFLLLSYTLGAMGFVGAVIFLAAVTALANRTKMFPAWTNILGWLAALGMLVGVGNLATSSGAVFAAGFVGFLLWAVWILVISWELWRSPATA